MVPKMQLAECSHCEIYLCQYLPWHPQGCLKLHLRQQLLPSQLSNRHTTGQFWSKFYLCTSCDCPKWWVLSAMWGLGELELAAPNHSTHSSTLAGMDPRVSLHLCRSSCLQLKFMLLCQHLIFSSLKKLDKKKILDGLFE